jgi:light-regulated signal transduction histidine kinase (bacteriophytochrome)
LPPEAMHIVNRVRSGAERMNKLIDDLLAFSRLGRKPLQKQPVDLAGLAQQAVEDLRDDYGARVAQVMLGALPPAEADPHLLRQVFVNLVGNALKFTRHQPAPRIEVGCGSQAGAPVYFVRDNGVGFNMLYADRLFGVFQRLHSTSEYEGTGVGLAIVQRIVNRHGGRVWVEAAVGQGATFYFTLPGAQI